MPRQAAKPDLPQCAGTKTGPDIAAVGPVEVSPCVAQQARARHPGAAAQHLVSAEPRLRIFSIRVNHEPRIRQEVACRPLPNVANHLAAAEMAVTRAQIRDVATPETVTVQVCLRRVRRFVAPGEAAFGS